ncbi:MAG TPA: flagellar hook-length control protein FliK [Acidiferrobacteraceae bacterium]|nr:flagellar hook-length control protein FliK [Acidiferrobacteraceae bacterium]
MIGSHAPITVPNSQVNGSQTTLQNLSNAGNEGGETPFSNVFSQQLGLFRLGQMSVLQNMMTTPPMAAGGQGLANFGQFLPGMYGSNSASPVTIINYNFFSLPESLGSSEQTDLAQLLESVDLGQLTDESSISPVPGLSSESPNLSTLSSLPVTQTSNFDIPKTPEKLGEKLAERLATLARGGDTEIKTTINHDVYGPIGIDVSIQNNRVSLNLSTGDAGLRTALEAATESLSKNIANQGLELAGFTVSGLNSINGNRASTSSSQAIASLYNSINTAPSPLDLINSVS